MNRPSREPPESALVPGDRVAERFEIIALAGFGGVGSVYRARDHAHGRVVALKLLHPDGEGEARFAREAAVLASLQHPGVVRYLDYGLAEGQRPYLVMEWLVGEDLDRRLRRAPLDVDDALTLGRAVAEALAAAHRQGIVHRDLKPANLFLVDGRFDAVKIVDFGLALPVTDDELTAPGALVGTPAYMAPEQVRGERVDVRADVYALGAVLFRSLSGRAVFTGDHQLAVLAKVLVEAAPELGELASHVPEALSSLIARMLAKEPSQRPSDGAAVLAELEALRAAGSAPSRLIPAVSTREQRVTSIVLSASAPSRAPEPQKPARPQDSTVDMPPLRSSSLRLSSGRHQVLREAVRSLGGTLDLLADGTRLVTVRGASPADQAALAAQCALALAALRPGSCNVVATGRVVVGGGLQVGEVIDRAAAALIALREKGAEGTRLDEATAQLLDDRFEARGEGAWRTLSASREGAAGPRTVLGRVTPCAGRARELQSLSQLFDDCEAEPRARAVLVVAAPGVGKSRLLHEFLRAVSSTRPGVSPLRARGDVARRGSPYALASQVLRRAAGFDEHDAPELRVARLRAMTGGLFERARARTAAEFLGALCGADTPIEDATPNLRAARAETALMSDGLRDAWVDWLRARCAQGPTILAFEDLQWGDLPSLSLVDAALDALADAPLFVVATARPEVRATFPDLWRKGALEEIHLGALSRRAAEQVVREALPGPHDAGVVDALVERAGGNPFHLEELVRAVASGCGPDVVPDSVLGMVQARIELLDGDARRTLRAASVFGERFWPGAIAALLGGSATAAVVSARLSGLIAKDFVVRRATSRIAGETEYAFRHALVRDAAYAMLPSRDQAHAHRLAGEWLEAAGEADPAALAEHFERGASPSQAARFLREAARDALDGNDLARAADLITRAATYAAEPATLGALRGVQAEVAFWRGEHDDAARHAADAAERLGEGTAPWFEAVAVAIGAYGQLGLNDHVARWLERVAAVTAAPDARGAQVSTLCRGLTQLYWAHHGSDLRGAHARLYALAQPFESLDPYHAGWVHRVEAEGLWLRTRDVDACLTAFEASCDAYERAGARRALCLAWINSASLHGWAGEFERSAALLALAEAESERLRSGFLTLYGRAVRGLVGRWSGDARAAETMRAVLPQASANPRVAFVLRVMLGGACFEEGAVDEAASHAQAALALPVVQDLKPAAMALFSRVLVARRAVSQGVEVAREAVRLEHATRDVELTEAMPDLALAEALEAKGDHAAAVEALTAGYARLDAIASRMASPERRRRFWSRRLPNDRIRALALAWGVITA